MLRAAFWADLSLGSPCGTRVGLPGTDGRGGAGKKSQLEGPALDDQRHPLPRQARGQGFRRRGGRGGEPGRCAGGLRPGRPPFARGPPDPFRIADAASPGTCPCAARRPSSGCCIEHGADRCARMASIGKVSVHRAQAVYPVFGFESFMAPLVDSLAHDVPGHGRGRASILDGVVSIGGGSALDADARYPVGEAAHTHVADGALQLCDHAQQQLRGLHAARGP